MTAKPIMLQGTMSGVGKSLLTAGLCRIFKQDGYTVAPFKSQNMALNSFICPDGSEIGRAQAMQAEAAGIEPSCALNPILLKPTTDVGSQVIVDGHPIGNMSAREYFAFKKSLAPHVKTSYERLAQRYDIVVIEGAGSPAEINLKDNDIVNMGMAKMARSPVVLIGDIDCGGVFAQLVGTQALLDEDERSLVKATIINKFRGDVSILEPGVELLQERMGTRVAGIVPYVQLDIEEEDSFSGRFATKVTSLVDIAVVRLPHLSNFSDFSSLSAMEGIEVRYVTRSRELGTPDLIIVPGTKSTIADLRWLRTSGLEAAILKEASRGVPVFGICGGYQMLGRLITDPDGAEGGGSIRGMGLLPTETVFSPTKRQVQTQARFAQVPGALSALTGKLARGYEIHMGVTRIVDEGSAAPLCMKRGEGDETIPEGCCCGNVYGSYLHGVFDTQECAQALVSSLLVAKGLDASAARAVDYQAYKEAQYDALAATLRASLDIDFIYEILEAGA